MVRATFRMLLARLPSTASTFAAASVTSAGAGVEFGHGHLHHSFGGGVERAEAFKELGGHAGIAAYLGRCDEAGLLDFAGALDALADGVRRFSGLGAREVLVFYGGDFDVDIDAVQQRA